MSNSNNHIDNWLQKSSEQANVMLNNQDWLHMKNLLQPKKKRRFIFWWFWFLASGLACILFILINKQAGKQTTNITSITKQANKKTVSTNTSNSIVMSKSNVAPIKNNATQNQINKYSINNGFINNVSPKKYIKIIDTARLTKIGFEKKLAQLTLLKNYPTAITSTQAYTNNTATQKEDLIFLQYSVKYPENKIDILKKDTVQLLLSKQNSPPDSLKNIKKNKLKKIKPNYLYAAIGYNFSNNNFLQNSNNWAIGYNKKISKHFSISPIIQLSKFNATSNQTFTNIIGITPILGTTNYFINKLVVVYKPTSGVILQQGLCIHYNTKKWGIECGLSFGKINTGANKTIVIDSMGQMANSFPSNLKPDTYKYNEANFAGKQFSKSILGVNYKINRRWMINVKSYFLLNQNYIDGVSNFTSDKVSNQINLNFIF